jgi:hypothetical protein
MYFRHDFQIYTAFCFCFRSLGLSNHRAPTTLKSEEGMTSLSGADKKEVRDNREKLWEYMEKSKYFYSELNEKKSYTIVCMKLIKF